MGWHNKLVCLTLFQDKYGVTFVITLSHIDSEDHSSLFPISLATQTNFIKHFSLPLMWGHNKLVCVTVPTYITFCH